MKMYEMTVKITFTDSVLGSLPGNKEIFVDHVAGNPDTVNEEMENIRPADPDEVIEKATTIFAKTVDGRPFFYDYQLRGYFKEACKFLKKVDKTLSSKEKAYKQKIDGMIFVKDRENIIDLNGKELDYCERPLRASTPQGERVALARSESAAEGSTCTFTVQVLDEKDLELVGEWLDYGRFHGTGQWRNSGHGRFTWEVIV